MFILSLDKCLLSSGSDDWPTPKSFFDELNKAWGFTLDPCSNDVNAKCVKHYTKEDDGLSKVWKNEVVFCNPPYGKDIPLWINKCLESWTIHGSRVAILIPARTDTRYFQKVLRAGCERGVVVMNRLTDRPGSGIGLFFIPGRLRFGYEEKDCAPFPSILITLN